MSSWESSVLCLMLLGPSLLAQTEDNDERNAMSIRPYAVNPFYWQYKGQPVIPFGGSVEDNLFQISDLEEHLDLLVASGGNYVRNTLSSRDPGNVWPFMLGPDGKYDLDEPNNAYYARLTRFLELTFERDIIVQFEMWDRFDYARSEWERNPFRPVNNVSYTVASSGLKNHYPRHPGTNDNPFFRTIPKQENNELVLKYQRAHIDRVLEISLKFPHVLYCMDNETKANSDWGAYWSAYIRRKASELGVSVQTTEMWDDWNLQGKEHRNTLDHPERYSFVDMSQNNHKKGQVHWDNLQWVRRYLKDSPRPINHVKAYGADGERFGNSRDGVERFWRTLLGGGATIRFHRPPAGLGLGEIAQRNIRSARMFVEAFDLTRATPGNDDAILADVEPNEAFITGVYGEAYAVYFPRGGEVTLTIPEGAERYRIRWLDIGAGSWGNDSRVEEMPILLMPPSDSQWVALIRIR